ncbi:MAG: AF1514 family protein [Pseudomonadota bacterium]
MFRLDRKSIFLLLLLTGVLAGIGYFLYASGLVDILLSKKKLVEFIRDHRQYAAVIFIGLQAMQVVAAPIPGEVTGFAGGVIFGPARGIIYSTIGLTIGSWVAFMLARLLGRPLVEKFVSPQIIDRYDYVMKHKGSFLAFLMFLIPGFPKDYLCYVLGLGHMRQRDFLLVSVSGRLLGTILLTMGGTYFRANHYMALFTLTGISLVIILAALFYRDRLEQWFRQMHPTQRIKSAVLRRSSKLKAMNQESLASCPLPSAADLSGVTVVELDPTPPAQDYQEAMQQANREATSRLGEPMLLSWYDRDRDFEVPAHVSECHQDGAVPGYVDYALHRGATVKVDIENGRFVFFYRPVES